MKPKYKPIIISLVVVSVVGYLIFTGIRDTMTYYLTVSEVLAPMQFYRYSLVCHE